MNKAIVVAKSLPRSSLSRVMMCEVPAEQDTPVPVVSLLNTKLKAAMKDNIYRLAAGFEPRSPRLLLFSSIFIMNINPREGHQQLCPMPLCVRSCHLELVCYGYSNR